MRRAWLLLAAAGLTVASPAAGAPAAVDDVPGAAAASAAARRSRIVETRVIGHSVQGRDIVAYRLGTPGGRVVLAIGIIHGNEPKGALISQRLRSMPVPAGIDLWVIDSINPDGQAAGTRQNAHRVDLNRNFERNWSHIPLSTSNNQYSGESPADQPETQATQQFIRTVQPQITVWWHQNANRVGTGGARPAISIEYARLVGQARGDTPCSAGCTGTATRFANDTVAGGTSFIVELPSSAAVTDAMVQRHADAFMAVITL